VCVPPRGPWEWSIQAFFVETSLLSISLGQKPDNYIDDATKFIRIKKNYNKYNCR
jgi:hypothetical protein